jgi:Domain of Unknown Function (DUF349)
MGIADFFRPKYRHSDVRVRTEAVRALTADDAAILVQIAKTDRDIGVRRIAMSKIDEATVLAELAAEESERSLRDFAGERAAELWTQAACSDDADRANDALGGMLKLGDQQALVEVVVRAALPAVRKRAFNELRDPRALTVLAKRDAPQEIRTAAVARIDDGDVLRALAIDTTVKEIGLAAVEKLDDIDRLENVALKAKNKAVRQKARKIVTEIQSAEREKGKIGVPDDVKRRRAEKAQLVRELEGLVETFDFAKASETVKAAEAAWVQLAPDDGDDKFTKLAERFWKRKEIHGQNARSADELRAIEREATAERDRARAKPAAAPVEEPKDDYVREASTPEDDQKRAAREAEAKARRDEQARLRAEEDERRAAQAAERAARQKEDAERGVAIAESLKAMVADMEQLAEQDHRDTRAIDRLLTQAAKGFEQIGKAPPVDRDAIAERYRTARGKLVQKAGDLREAEDWVRWANVPKAEALINAAKEMIEEAPSADLGNRLRGLQALWKEVGPMPQRRSKELWEQFKALCDQVYDKVKGVRAVEQEKFGEVIAVKEALIAEAEALADSTDWANTANQLKALQAKWKDSGHLPRKQGDELWKRFRAACDRFFERRKPQLEARQNEEMQNLAKKQALITKAHEIARRAPDDGGWGKAITQIKDVQRDWKEIGFVPRRDADALWAAFRTACDGLFQKRDASRDAEANAHHAEVEALRTEIEMATVEGDITRALAARAKATELEALADEVQAMIKQLVTSKPDAVKGTELDPTALRNKREKLIARAEELLPKQTPQASGDGDVAAQLKAAMRQNAFGDLRFSGRDPVEVADELRASWADSGPLLEDEDRAQAARFETTIAKVLESAGASKRPEREERPDRGDRGDRGERRRRRDRNDRPANAAAEIEAVSTHTSPITIVPDAAASAVAAIEAPVLPPEEIATQSSVPVATHDAITQPAALPPEVPIGIDVRATPLAPPPDDVVARAKSDSLAPKLDEMDEGWDLGESDPTAAAPSSSEMAGDGSVEGDGLDQVD